MNKLVLGLKNIIFSILGICINTILIPIAAMVVLGKHVSRIANTMDRKLNDLKLRGKVRKK